MTICISALETARAAMTSGPYLYNHRGSIESLDRGINHSGAETEVLVLGARNEHDDGIGIVAEHNAIPALIVIAKLALAYEAAKEAAAKVRASWANWGNGPDRATRTDDDQLVEHIDAVDRHEVACRLAYVSALAEVTP